MTHRKFNVVSNLLFIAGLLAITGGWMWAVSDLDWWRILLNVGLALLAWSGLVSWLAVKLREQR